MRFRGGLSGAVLVLLYLLALAAPLLAPNDPREAPRRDGITLAGHPPQIPRVSLSAPVLYYVPSTRVADPATGLRRYVPDPARRVSIFARGGEPWFPLGSDSLGRCLASRILYGGRVSLTVGLLGTAIALGIGTLVGTLAGVWGGAVDALLMRIVEALLMIPGLYLLLALSAVLPSSLSSSDRYAMIIVVLSAIGWASLARVVRGIVLTQREKDFVRAHLALGASRLRVATISILPNLAPYLLVVATLSVPGYILGESALSLLGMGIQEPDASWGNLLDEARKVSAIRDTPWLLLPGLFIAAATVAFNRLGDLLRDRFDPLGLRSDPSLEEPRGR